MPLIKKVLFAALLVAAISQGIHAQDNPFSVDTVVIDTRTVNYTDTEALQKQLMQSKVIVKPVDEGWTTILKRILQDIAAGVIPRSEKANVNLKKYVEEKIQQDKKKQTETNTANQSGGEPSYANSPAPGAKGASTGSANFKKWFDDAAKYSKDWNFPTVTNKYGKVISREDYLRAIIWIESRGIHKSPSGKITKSWAGALGFMQLMPNTAKGLGIDANDPAQNLKGGSKYLKEIFNSGNVSKKSGEEKLIMGACAYNLGPFSKSMKSSWDTFKLNSKIPVETRSYGLKLKMCLGLHLTKDEEDLVKKYLVEKGQTVKQLTDDFYSHTHGIAR
ncbi:MAG: transglycosylase SLT domain-containing protein [Candidatus Rifleibacteriota bacterium]